MNIDEATIERLQREQQEANDSHLGKAQDFREEWAGLQVHLTDGEDVRQWRNPIAVQNRSTV